MCAHCFALLTNIQTYIQETTVLFISFFPLPFIPSSFSFPLSSFLIPALRIRMLRERDGTASFPCAADGEVQGRREKRARADDAALRAMSAAEIDAYIAQAQRAEALPRAEVQRLRRVRRAIRNREYARLSRDKRSAYVGRVERELLAARDENRALRERLAALAAELERLRGGPPAPPSSAPSAPPSSSAQPLQTAAAGPEASSAQRQDSAAARDESPTTTAEVAATVPHGIGATCLL